MEQSFNKKTKFTVAGNHKTKKKTEQIQYNRVLNEKD